MEEKIDLSIESKVKLKLFSQGLLIPLILPTLNQTK
jgi:hypothetical protein